MNVLRTDGVTKAYRGREVVRGVNLEVPMGEVVGLLGPNGAGKTTTFYTIVGLIKPNQGGIFLNGEEVTHLPVHLRARKGIGYLSQEPSVFRKLSVEDNIMAILETIPLSRNEREKQLEAHLNELKITHLSKQKASTLSGGERRRVEIARALVTKPSFLLLDEPFTGVDPILKGEIQDIVRELKNKGIGVLITDHNVRETLEITDRAYIIYDGKILFSGSAQELIQDEKAREVYLGKDFKM
jgi:lipopolysaccharide export system ATP-binding protein